MIIFEKIRYKNIMSVGETPVELDLKSHQTTLVVGKNGGGKSTITEALSFVLYGKPFRKLSKNQLINNVNGKGLLVDIWFSSNGKEYHVRRGIKPNLFEIEEDGTKWHTESKATLMQESLETKVLKMSHKTFSQNAVLGVTSYVPFMLMDASSRRKFVEDLLDLDIFRKMSDIVKTKANDNKNMMNRANTDLEVINAKIDGVNDKIKALQKQNEGFINELKDSLRAEVENIKNLEDQITEAEEQYQSLIESLGGEYLDTDYTSAISDLKSQIQLISRTTSSKEQEIALLEHTAVCNSCGQNIDEDFRKTKIANIHDEVGNALQHKKSMEENLERLEKLKADVDEAMVPIHKAESHIASMKSSLSFMKMKAKDVAIQIKKKSEEKIEEVDENEIEVLKKKRNLITGALTNLQKQKEIIAAAVALLKDDGIKASVIEQYVPVINSLIRSYLTKFELFVDFSLDNSFEETIKSSNASEFSYESFSEGERLRIDISILLTWRAIAKMRNSASTNLLIMDEVLDSSMDTDGTMVLVDALKEMHQDENILIISHKSDGLDERFDRVINTKKVKGFTTMEVLS